MSKEKYMDYIKFVDINNKKIYDIGKRSSAKEEFQEIFEKIGGKVVTNLEDYIRYKYRPA